MPQFKTGYVVASCLALALGCGKPSTTAEKVPPPDTGKQPAEVKAITPAANVNRDPRAALPDAKDGIVFSITKVNQAEYAQGAVLEIQYVQIAKREAPGNYRLIAKIGREEQRWQVTIDWQTLKGTLKFQPPSSFRNQRGNVNIYIEKENGGEVGNPINLASNIVTLIQ